MGEVARGVLTMQYSSAESLDPWMTQERNEWVGRASGTLTQSVQVCVAARAI